MPFLNKLENVFVQVIRLVLLAFSAVVLLALILMLVDKFSDTKEESISSPSIVWSDIKPNTQFVLEETGRDMGIRVPDKSLQERLQDPQLRAAFLRADQLVRTFVAQAAEQHAQVEEDYDANGLAPLNPILLNALSPTERARFNASTPATDAAAYESSECCYTAPVDVVMLLNERATQAQSEYDAAAYAPFVLGAPAAIAQVLNDPTLAPKLHELTVERLVNMILTNYSISFSQAVNAQNEQHTGSADDSDGLWSVFFDSLTLTLWSVIFSFLVLVVFVVVALRIEKHLRVMAHHQPPRS